MVALLTPAAHATLDPLPAPDRAGRYPRGTVTFLFTDIEGSTVLWERDPEAMREAVNRHIALLQQVIDDHGGVHFKTVGDAMQAAFPTAPQGVLAAVAGQRGLLAASWPGEIGALHVRMALHTGMAEPEAGDYLAPMLNRLSRLLSAGHGGQILVSSAARGLLADDGKAGITLRPLGVHALRDLQEPEPVFQVVAPGLRDHFPALRALPHHPTNLLAQPTRLIGRDSELASVDRLLRESTARLVTLTGAGGSGKTRLAVEIATEVLDAFADGAYLVDLAPLRDPGLVPAAIASTLGAREVAGEQLLDSLITFIGQKRLLLLLDNCEHVLDAAPGLAVILARCPALTILATSREPLSLRGEQIVAVDPLTVPETDALSVEEIAQIPAVALFVERASASNPAFRLTAVDAAAVAAICRGLDGLPLAIELAAARTRLLPPRALLERLTQRLSLLTCGPRDLPERQRTLRDTIAWSHQLLTEHEQVLFRHLAVFTGGADLAIMEQVVDPERQLDILMIAESLVAQNLLRIDARQNDVRFTMLETIREFALDELAASDEESCIRRRHAEQMLALAEAGTGPRLPGEEVAGSWLAQMEREHENIRAALAWLLEQRDAARALRLGAAAGTFWSWHDHWTEGRRLLEQVLAISDGGDPVLLARAMLQAGSFAYAQGDNREAIRLLEPGQVLPRDRETRPWLLRIWLKLAHAHGQLRAFAEATAHYEQALALAIESGARPEALEIRWSMAYTATSQGELTRAREIAEAILEDDGVRSDPLALAGTRELLAWIALSADDLDQAESLLEDARSAAQHAPEWADGLRQNLLIDEAVLAYRRGEHERSAALVRQLLARACVVDDRQELLFALLVLSSIAIRTSQESIAVLWLGTLAAALDTGEQSIHLEPAIRPWHEADIAHAREVLGEAAFARLRQEGSRLPLKAALDQAVQATLPGRRGQALLDRPVPLGEGRAVPVPVGAEAFAI